MERSAAPYADTALTLSLTSATGLRYRTVHCLECGREIIERNKDDVFRIGAVDEPREAKAAADGFIHSTCSRCLQTYLVQISEQVAPSMSGIPLYMQPQSLFIETERRKHLRDIFCMECGKAYFSVSDRMTMVVDNVAPAQLWDKGRMGPMEARCKFQHCKQRWYLRV